LWQLSLDDLAPTRPARISVDEAVLVDLGGEMRGFDLATGTVLWQHNVGSDVNVSPVVGAGLIVIMDRGGSTTAFEAGDGQHRWDQEMQGAAGTVIGDSVVVIQDQTAHALWTTTGTHRWVRSIFGTLTDMATFAGHVVVATKSQSVILGGEGVVLQRLGPVLTLTLTQDHLMAWGPTEARVIARDGTVISRWELPPLTLSQQDRPALALTQGVLLFNNDWTFQAREDVS
jgi:outer membrane protein assembly factor BamB